MNIVQGAGRAALPLPGRPGRGSALMAHVRGAAMPGPAMPGPVPAGAARARVWQPGGRPGVPARRLGADQDRRDPRAAVHHPRRERPEGAAQRGRAAARGADGQGSGVRASRVRRRGPWPGQEGQQARRLPEGIRLPGQAPGGLTASRQAAGLTAGRSDGRLVSRLCGQQAVRSAGCAVSRLCGQQAVRSRAGGSRSSKPDVRNRNSP
jgi:hypothetical protein